MNEEELIINNKKIKDIKRAIGNRKNNNKDYDDLFLRVSELKTSIIHYETYLIVLKDRIIEFEWIKNDILVKI